MAEQAWRPRPCGYAHGRSGSPWVPVRPYYEGPPPSGGWYGPDEGRGKPPGSRGMKIPGSDPTSTVPGWKTPQVERREASALIAKRAAPSQGARTVKTPFGALLPQ